MSFFYNYYYNRIMIIMVGILDSHKKKTLKLKATKITRIQVVDNLEKSH